MGEDAVQLITPPQINVLRQLVGMAESRKNFDIRWTLDGNGGSVALAAAPGNLVAIHATIADMIDLCDAGMFELPVLSRESAAARLTDAAIDAMERMAA